MNQELTRRFALVIVVIGFIIIVLGAANYLMNLGFELSTTAIGVVLIAVGMRMFKKK